MSLKDQGFRFCISPSRKDARWLHPAEQTAFYPDWLDVTDWDAKSLLAYLENPAEAIIGMEENEPK